MKKKRIKYLIYIIIICICIGLIIKIQYFQSPQKDSAQIIFQPEALGSGEQLQNCFIPDSEFVHFTFTTYVSKDTSIKIDHLENVIFLQTKANKPIKKIRQANKNSNYVRFDTTLYVHPDSIIIRATGYGYQIGENNKINFGTTTPYITKTGEQKNKLTLNK